MLTNLKDPLQFTLFIFIIFFSTEILRRHWPCLTDLIWTQKNQVRKSSPKNLDTRKIIIKVFNFLSDLDQSQSQFAINLVTFYYMSF